jgi:hypothetical protein
VPFELPAPRADPYQNQLMPDPPPGTRIVNLPPASDWEDADHIAIDHPVLGTRKLSRPMFNAGLTQVRLVPVILILGASDDYALIDLGAADVVQVSCWVPNHTSGQPYFATQEMLPGPPRQLRVSFAKGIVPGGFVDVVLTGRF